MKKITALFLIISFLFNLFGYRLVIEYMQYKSDYQLEASLNNNLYDNSQLVELKVPLQIPYLMSWSAYQRYDGEIEIGGKIYKYVERKIANDTLYLKCISNDKKMHLEIIKNNYFNATNDIVQNGIPQKTGNSKNVTLKNLHTDYENCLIGMYTLTIQVDFQCNWPILINAHLFSCPSLSPEQPPDYCKA